MSNKIALVGVTARKPRPKPRGGSGRKGGFQPHLDTMAEQDMEELPPALDSTDVLEMVLDKLKVRSRLLSAARSTSSHPAMPPGPSGERPSCRRPGVQALAGRQPRRRLSMARRF